jgi:hopene-associated glycosyltransferase HpnB
VVDGVELKLGTFWGLVTDPGSLSAIAFLSLLIWVVLLFFWGRFWCGTERLPARVRSAGVDRDRGSVLDHPLPIECPEQTDPSVIAVIPARNEAAVLPEALRSILSQGYRGRLRVVLVDDGSTDGTGDLARELARSFPGVRLVAIDDHELGDRVQPTASHANSLEFAVMSPPPLPQGWTGKLWALDRGIAAARSHWGDSDYVWLTDADIAHPPDNLQRLVDHARHDRRELVSLMVRLRCQSLWERLMVPAFIFFFQKLYPFPWVNDPRKAMAAAAGGCILIHTAALDRIGGIGCVREALIDDCALASAVKHLEPDSVSATMNSTDGFADSPTDSPTDSPVKPQTQRHADRRSYRRIWLGLSRSTHSLRPYDSLASLWDMVARTAYTQLNYSPLLLAGTILGMILVYLVPPISAIGGLVWQMPSLAIIGGLTWTGMVVAYRPTLRSYEQPTILGVLLPAIASIYLLATIDSAWRHWRGRGGAWKGRTYAQHP